MIKKSFSHIGVVFLSFFSLLPTQFLYIISAFCYYILYYLVGYRKKVVRENLVNSFPEKSIKEIIHIEKRFFRYFADLAVEVIKMSSISEKEVLKRVKFKNLHLVEAHFNKGESVLACTGHYGNWEWGMLALGLQLSKTSYVIYKPLNNKIFDNWFLKMRSKYGNVCVPMRQTLRMLTSKKDEPSMFCFASDQSPVRGEAHYWLNFLNQDTSALLGLEKIALQTNRPIFYFKLTYLKRGYYEVECVPICPVPKETKEHEITDTHFRFLEKIINEDPSYWLWSHRRWKTKREYAS
ncbi:lysophospholipid acyltransferase family protein [Pedobacter gandavensis]|uniref:lysophospholipid acyltransferase family protein n=1 Tax=Pedobacter gandavensis TaxID=2679963 RepID=UPI0029302F48|nr:lysophospholipid acyltransferase family protein [Pedobacter gandavensis]